MFGIGASELLIVIALLSGSGGIGLPLGMPPLPEDPLMARVAPQECLWYWSWAGTAEPDPKSSNETEQLLAEPEIQNFLGRIEVELGKALNKGAGESAESKTLAAEAPKVIKTLLTRPAAVFIAKFDMKQNQPEVEAGLVVNLGAKSAVQEMDNSLRKLESVAFQGAKIEELKEGDTTWRRLPLPPGPPRIVWGIKGRYLIVSAGKTSPAEIVKRGSTQPPSWYSELRKQLPVERVSMVSYLNLEGVVASIPEASRAQAAPALRALGLHQFKSVTNVTGMDDKGVVSRTLVKTVGEATGLLSVAEGNPLTAKDLQHIPRDAAFANVVRFDIQKGFDEFLQILEKISPREADSFRQGMTQVETQFGFSFSEDLFKALGDVWSIHSSPSGGGLLFNGVTVVVQVRDRQRLEKINQLILALAGSAAPRQGASGPFGRGPSGATVKQMEVGKETVHFVNFIGVPVPFAPAWSLTRDQLVIGLFPQAVKSHLSRGTGNGSLADLPEITQALNAKPGPILISYQDTAEVFQLVYPLVQMFAQVAASNLQSGGVELDISMLPSASAILPHLSPSVTVAVRTEDGIRTESRRSLPTGGGISGVAPIATGLLLPAVQSARHAARRAQSTNNLKQIALAMHNFHDVHKSFPSATTTPKGGNLSWRVQILPFIEQQALFNQFKLDEPWDSEHNKKLIPHMPQTYASPNSTMSREGKTNYLTVRGEGTIFPDEEKGIGIAKITDGTSNTILALEVNDDRAVIWTKPDDYEFDPDNPTAGLGLLQGGAFLAAMADGSVRTISLAIDPQTLKNLYTRADGEVVGQFNVPDVDVRPAPAVERAELGLAPDAF